MATDTVARNLSRLPVRLRIALGLWLLCGVILAFVARTGASMVALFVMLFGIVYAYASDNLREPGVGRRARAPGPRNSTPADSGVPEEAHHFILREFAAAQRGRPLALVMFGFQGFTSFADRVGPKVADAAVVEFGRVLQRMTRRMNLSARYGWRADTFLSVLSDADVTGAQAFVARVRAATARLDLPMPEIDAGIALYLPHMHSPQELVAAAERSLAGARADARPTLFVAADPPSMSRITSRARALLRGWAPGG